MVEIRKQLGQPFDGLFGVQHLCRIGVKRRRRQAGRQDDAVAIDDVGAPGGRQRRRVDARQSRLAAGLEHGEVDQAPGDHGERQCQHDAGDQEPVAAGLKRLLADAVDAEGGGLVGGGDHRG